MDYRSIINDLVVRRNGYSLRAEECNSAIRVLQQLEDEGAERAKREAAAKAAAKPTTAKPASKPKPKNRISAAARTRIAAAQRKRWADYQKQKTAKDAKPKVIVHSPVTPNGRVEQTNGEGLSV